VNSAGRTLRAEFASLHAIVDAETAARAGWPILDLAAAFLRGGARLLQFRAKSMPGDAFLATASAVVQLAHHHQARVIVNDRADIARLASADGVHVGQDDLPAAAVRTLVGRESCVGLSTHSLVQVDRALAEPVDYIAIGPVFGTTTKDTGYEKVGLDMVREAARRTRTHALPLVAIGGITLETAASVIDAGAASVAVIGDLLSTGDPEARVRAFVERLSRSERPRV
jgi:thiamine-phosphate pyrophosphorylase